MKFDFYLFWFVFLFLGICGFVELDFEFFTLFFCILISGFLGFC